MDARFPLKQAENNGTYGLLHYPDWLELHLTIHSRDLWLVLPTLTEPRNRPSAELVCFTCEGPSRTFLLQAFIRLIYEIKPATLQVNMHHVSRFWTVFGQQLKDLVSQGNSDERPSLSSLHQQLLPTLINLKQQQIGKDVRSWTDRVNKQHPVKIVDVKLELNFYKLQLEVAAGGEQNTLISEANLSRERYILHIYTRSTIYSVWKRSHTKKKKKEESGLVST